MKILFLLSTLLTLPLVSYKIEDMTIGSITPENEKDLLVGKWNIVKGEIRVNGELDELRELKDGDCDYNYYEFKSDGSKVQVYHNSTENCTTENVVGTWTYKADEKLITLKDNENGYVTKYNLVSVNSNELKLKIADESVEAPPKGIELYFYLIKN